MLDPVGVGATRYRTQVCKELLVYKPTVIRGNASEIISLAGAAGNTKGVDSTASSNEAIAHAKDLALCVGCVVAVSGEVDMVSLTV